MLFTQAGVMEGWSLLGPAGGLRAGDGDRLDRLVHISPRNGPWCMLLHKHLCGASWHGSKSGRVLQLKQYGPWAVRCWGLPNPLLFGCVGTAWEPGLTDRPRESADKGRLSMEAGSSCDSKLQAQGEDGMGVLTFQCFLSSSSFFTLLQQPLRLHTARAIYRQPPSCWKVNTGSERSPVWSPEPEGSSIHLISRYVDCDQHHSNYLSHLNELDTEIATLVIYTAPFIGKLKNARYQFHWVGKLHSFVDTEVP